MAVTIYYFPASRMTGDIDNIVKPILDAMIGPAYVDDRQIERIVAQKFEEGRLFQFTAPSIVLATALANVGPTVYICISDDPHEDLR